MKKEIEERMNGKRGKDGGGGGGEKREKSEVKLGVTSIAVKYDN